MLIPMIHKIPSKPITYAVIFENAVVQTVDSLHKARRYIHDEYGVTRDPTLDFFTPLASHVPLYSLDLFAFNICQEARFVNIVTDILKEQGPMQLLKVMEIAIMSHDISPNLSSRYIIKNIIEDGDFWFSDEMLYLVNPLQGNKS